ncbi:MAG TPA: ABC transporter permease [Gemmatimonadaceae bacterium]|jgi:predicted permease
MKWLDRLLQRRRLYDDLACEIRSHLDEKTDELIARGLAPAAARAAARRAFGNVTRIQEQGRDVWQWPTIDSMLADGRFALRQMRRVPTLSITIVLTLAIGIAATATVFSWTRSVLLDPLPGAGAPSRVMALETTTASGSWTPTSWLDYRDFRRYLKSFDGLAAAYPTALAFGDALNTERIWGELVSANFFDVLRVRPALGSFFPSGVEESEGAQPVVVISHSLWQRRWHGDSTVIGRVVDINRFPFRVVGVAAREFHGSMPGEQFDAWVPAAMLGQIVPTGAWWLRDRGTRTFRVLARLRDGVTLGAARSEVEALAALAAQANGAVSKGMGGRLMPLWQSHYGAQDALRSPLVVLLVACALVLLIVCANAASLLLARATARARELGLRMALGAPRGRLLRQLLTEASLLAVSGAAIGLVCTIWLARSLNTLVPSFARPMLRAPQVNGTLLAFTALLAVGVTVLAGLVPALQGSRAALVERLAGGGERGAVGSRQMTRARRTLVTIEMTLAVVSLVGAGLFYESFRHTRDVSPGFDPNGVAMASVSLTLAGYDSAQGEAFLTNTADRLAREPGVTDVTYTDYVPLSFGPGSWEDLRVEGYAPAPNENMKLYRAAIGPNYFKVLHVPLAAGREFTLADDSAHAAVMIVNEAFIRRFLGGGPAIGVRVHGWGRWFTIVGVSKDTKFYRLTESPTPYFYVPVRQVYRPEYSYAFLVRTAGPLPNAVQAIEHAVRAIDPSVPLFNAMSFATYVNGPLEGQHAAMQLLIMLAAIASLLAAIGLYGVVSYAVAQRTKEIGIRVALGARQHDVLQVVVGHVGRLLLVGVVLGLGISIGVARLVASMLYQVPPASVAVFAAAATVMVLVSLVATGVPARRALRIAAVVALRED